MTTTNEEDDFAIPVPEYDWACLPSRSLARAVAERTSRAAPGSASLSKLQHTIATMAERGAVVPEVARRWPKSGQSSLDIMTERGLLVIVGEVWLRLTPHGAGVVEKYRQDRARYAFSRRYSGGGYSGLFNT